MLLDLNKLHGQREHFERVFEPSAFCARRPRLPRRGTRRAVDGRREGGKGRVSRHRARHDHARVVVQPVRRAVRDAGRRPVRAALRAAAETPAEDEKEIAEDDLTTAFYSEGSLDVDRVVARAVSARAADEAAVQRWRAAACAPSAGRI